MDLKFSSSVGILTLCFNPSETVRASVLMQSLFEDEKERGNSVPNFGQDFFKDFASAEDGVNIVFNFKYLGLALRFIEEVIDNTDSDDKKKEALLRFLISARAWYDGAHALQ